MSTYYMYIMLCYNKISKMTANAYTKLKIVLFLVILLAMKAALLIQRWYRRYLARMEVRRRYTWTIFQSIEYAGEQDQVRVSSLFIYYFTYRNPIR